MSNNIKAGAEIHAGDGGYSIGTQERYQQFADARTRSLNSPIRRLADIALDQAVPETWTTLSYDQLIRFQDKFAELIVRECSHLVTTRDGRTEPATHIYLLKAFGIQP